MPSSSMMLCILLTTVLAYVVVVGVLRLAGPRVLSKLNAFDLVVTVAVGSLLASVITHPGPQAVTGLLALVTLIGLQVLLTRWTSSHPGRDGVIRAEPVVVVRNGELLEESLLQARLTPREVNQAVRSSGFGGLDVVAAVCLETDGTLSVIGRASVGDGSALDALH
ncbi:DUF421 domain-containing protein [Luteococcus sediminum]